MSVPYRLPASSSYHPSHGRASSRFFWVCIVAFSWSALGLCTLVYGMIGMMNLDDTPRLEAESLLLPYVALFVTALLFIGSFGVTFRYRWGYFFGLVLSIILLPLFPIGTVIGFAGIRALVGSKNDFGL